MNMASRCLSPAKDQHQLSPSNMPSYQDTWKSWGSSLLLPPVSLLLPSCLLWYQKDSGEIASTLFPCLLPLLRPSSPEAHAEPLAIGRWTASLSAALMNVIKPKWSEGAKTKVLLQRIHCVNILAGGGAVATIYRQRKRCRGSYLTRGSPLHAPRWLISKNNISVMERCRDSALDLLQWCCCADMLHSSHSWELRRAGN